MKILIYGSLLIGFTVTASAQQLSGPGVKDEPSTAVMEVQDEKRHTSQNFEAPKKVPQNQEAGPRTQDLPPKFRSKSEVRD